MSVNNKVVWSEGLFLRPQHFQQQERYLERYVETRCAPLVSHAWGFTSVEIEHDLLNIGKLGLRRATGVFPDGTPMSMPDDDPLPDPIDVGPNVRDEVVYLAMPVRRAGSVEVDRGAGAEQLARHAVREYEAPDAASGSTGAAVLEVGALRTKLLRASEVTDAYACIPLTQIVECRADRRVVLDDGFIPTVLDARSALRLSTFMTEVIGLLNQRGEALGGRVSATGRGGAAEIGDFLMLQAVNRYQPVLEHCAAAGVWHPEDFYRFCAGLAGEFATFTLASKRPVKLDVYRHERLRESFDPVIAAIRKAFATEMVQMAVPIPIEKKRFGIHVGTPGDKSLFATAFFVLAARADVPAEDLRRRFPSQIKIGTVDNISDLVNLQLPGVPLRPLPTAPRQIPFHAGFSYFELDQSHEMWALLKTAGGVAFHIAGEFPGLAMEFWAIRS
jgi:type VI secretion system protein ImpJ